MARILRNLKFANVVIMGALLAIPSIPQTHAEPFPVDQTRILGPDEIDQRLVESFEELELYEFLVFGGSDYFWQAIRVSPIPNAPREVWEKFRKQTEEMRRGIQLILDQLRRKELENWRRWISYDRDGDGQLSSDELRAMLKEKISCGNSIFYLLTCDERDQLVEEIIERLLCDTDTRPMEPGPVCRAEFVTKEGIIRAFDRMMEDLEKSLGRHDCSIQTDPRSRDLCEQIRKSIQDMIDRLKKAREKFAVSEVDTESEDIHFEQLNSH